MYADRRWVGAAHVAPELVQRPKFAAQVLTVTDGQDTQERNRREAEAAYPADQAVGQITGRADPLKSNATTSLLLTSIVTLLLLILLISTALARPLRTLLSGTLDAVTR
jgi:hypothetical protein